MKHLWGVEYRFDWGRALLWSGWDRRWNGPNGDLLPILFRTRRAAREWIATYPGVKGYGRPARVDLVLVR